MAVSFPKTCLTEVSMNRFLLDVPYEVLFQIFCEISKGKLIEISRLCAKFRAVAGDSRLWKDVYIKYKAFVIPTCDVYSFDRLYSGPWPVKEIDLSYSKITPSIFTKTHKVVKVFTLNLSSIKADEFTIEAILDKYQCTELRLDNSSVDPQNRIMGIEPEAFSNQTALEMLSLKGMTTYMSASECREWLVPVLSNCQNLKTLDLSWIGLDNDELLGFVTSLPTSLEKLFLAAAHPVDSFFKLLAETTPNLKELKLCGTRINFPSLFKLQFLEVLHVVTSCTVDMDVIIAHYRDISNYYMCLTKFPALKTVYMDDDDDFPEASFNKLQTKLKSYGIIVTKVEEPKRVWPVYRNVWVVSNTV